MKREIAPSILSANFINLKKDLDVLYDNGIKYIHLDVMDGNFVPNISFGTPVVESICNNYNGKFIFDAHLMVNNPKIFIEKFKSMGVDIFTIHYEIDMFSLELIESIKKTGMKVGVSINPDTDEKKIFSILDKIDLVLVMSVFPGFGGQKFIENSIEKIKILKKYISENNLKAIIEVDGGINFENAENVILAGCDIMVCGTTVFKGDINYNIKKLNQIINK